MPQDTNLSRYEQFLTTSVEDHEGRAMIGLTEEDYDHLHGLAVDGIAPWNLYYQVNTARKADFIYLKGGKEKGWSITKIREQLNRVESRTFTEQGEEVSETVSYRCWPAFRHIQRTRKKADSTVYEVELAYPSDANVEELFAKYTPGFEEETMLDRFKT